MITNRTTTSMEPGVTIVSKMLIIFIVIASIV
jgi:hypothetical protein